MTKRPHSGSSLIALVVMTWFATCGRADAADLPVGGPGGYTAPPVLNDVFGSTVAGGTVTSISQFNQPGNYGPHGHGWDRWMKGWGQSPAELANVVMHPDCLEMITAPGPGLIVSHWEGLPTADTSYYIEVKARIGAGLFEQSQISSPRWPAIWLYEGNDPAAFNNGAEIDIMEHWDNLNYGHQSADGGYYEYFQSTSHTHGAVGVEAFRTLTPGIDLPSTDNIWGCELRYAGGKVYWDIYFNGALVQKSNLGLTWDSSPPAIILDPGSNSARPRPCFYYWARAWAKSTAPVVIAPTITSQPIGRTVAIGQPAVFSVIAAGTPPLSYRWQKNGVDISGATSSSYTTPAAFGADTGATFRVLVSNSAGSATSDSATLTVAAPSTSGPVSIDCGGATVGAFVGDVDVSGGASAVNWSGAVDTHGVSGAAPVAVYQSERWGNFVYTIPGLTAGAAYTVRLHYTEDTYAAAGQRLQDVAINGVQVLTHFDIFAAAGAMHTAVVRQFTAPANASGQLVIAFAGVASSPDHNAKVDGIEVHAASVDPVIGTGTGLAAIYYDNLDFTGAAVRRIDPTVNFAWGTSPPVAGIGSGTYSVRWTGQLQAQYSQTYTLSVVGDDGVRLWVNGQRVIDQWHDQPPTESSASVALVAGQRYDVVLEYYQNGGGAVAQLSWASPSTAKQIVPTTQLYPVALPSGWSATDLGVVTLAGSVSFANGACTLTGSGADIWGVADAGEFASQTLSGDGSIVARVVSVQNTDAWWAKAGVMIRESTAAGAKQAFCCVTSGSGVAFQRRPITGGISSHTAGSPSAAPRWVKLVRQGATITAFESADGVAWTRVGVATISLANQVLIGLAVTSHNPAALCTAVFDHVVITPGASG